jgi:hypothetical protein
VGQDNCWPQKGLCYFHPSGFDVALENKTHSSAQSMILVRGV